jgi:NitT/TauT family transport system substrate-binding protein
MIAKPRPVTFLALVACAMLGFAGAPRPAAADDTLTIMRGAIAPALSNVLDIVAENVGFFKAEHLTIVEQNVNNPATAAALVATGKGDLCSLSAEAVLQGYPRGLKLEYFYTFNGRYSNVLAVLDSSPIRTLADLRGKNIGVINIGSAGQVTAQIMLAGAGLSKSDVTFSPIGVGPQALEAVIDKRVDAVGYPTGEVVPMEVLGHITMRVFRDPILADVKNAGYAAAPATIQTRGDVLKRFLRAITKAAIFVRYNPQVSARYFLEAEGTRITPQSLADKARELVLLRGDLPADDPADKQIGYMSPRDMDILSKTLTAYGVAPQVVPASAIVTNEFIDYANDFDRAPVIALARHMHLDSGGQVVP